MAISWAVCCINQTSLELNLPSLLIRRDRPATFLCFLATPEDRTHLRGGLIDRFWYHHVPGQTPPGLFPMMKTHSLNLWQAAIALSLTLSPFFSTWAQKDSNRPNVIVVLVDDLGYSDLGCYGSEIETPTLDRLAAEGLRFSQFYNTAKCHSSRVSLLSGRWCMQAGDTALTRAVILPEVLKPAGYFTAMAGKWHLKKEPTDFGFQRYFGHLSGACNYYKGDDTFRLNGEPWQVPDEGFYTTVANVDYALNFLNEARQNAQPYFLYLAFNAPHAPLQPLEEDYKKYEGRYDEGWDEIRAARVARQKEIGLFDASVEASPRPDHVPAWNDLSPEFKEWENRRMTALAGMIDRIDQEMSRLIADLETHGELDNTLILLFSDNGACPYDRRSIGIDEAPYLPDTEWSDSTGWAWARNTPFRFYKQNQFEGGVATPAIVHWPAGLKTEPGSINRTPAHLVDVLPTIAEIAQAEIPATWPDREPSALAGVSLAPIFAGGELKERPPIHLLYSKDRGLRMDNWKLVSFRSTAWELYDLANDRTELHNLAEVYPDRVAEMAALWDRITKEELRAKLPPVSAKSGPYENPEWTIYDSPEASSLRKLKGKAEPGAKKPKTKTSQAVRARKDTKLKIEDGLLVLTCTGDDSGLAFDHLNLKESASGPYTLTFELSSDATTGEGEIYFTTDEDTTLPNGTRVPFTPKHSGDWESFSLTLDTEKPLAALRFDPSSSPGTARVRGLRVLDARGAVVAHWPEK